MSKVVNRKSVLPIYLIGIVWLLWAIFGTLNRPIHFVLAAVVSVLVYIVGKAIFPNRTFTVKEDEPPRPRKKRKSKKRTSPPIPLKFRHSFPSGTRQFPKCAV